MKKLEIDYQQVTYLEAEQNYTRICFTSNKIIIIPRTLMRFEEDLISQSNFVRITRGCIVNKNYIKINDEYEVKMICGKTIPIARRRSLGIF
jgi:DNA-binding LytR/AlgR family response regulator